MKEMVAGLIRAHQQRLPAEENASKTDRESQEFEQNKEHRASTFIDKVRSLGLRTKAVASGKRLLIGKKTCSWVNMMEERIPAILDTGSRISILPVAVLAQAKEKGVDIDSLELITDADLKPVYDASDNKMNS
ncbi:hypothetical protein OESDEN_04581 [Oesophagostomum dentatum]|uniref:Uncharacterized protein n=1 Tax=Oesophagostomum dentatum TaxID=61180 RepID=A0A0B1TD36_OESDE|nr:hypothetical protein OESDEN_04581 [Oesophagostomum dentatum]